MEGDRKIEAIQRLLAEHQVDGWLLFDNHGSNRFARQILGISSDTVLTRRFFYWIPVKGLPQKIVHRIESESLSQISGSTHLYLSWNEMQTILRQVLQGVNRVFMEYSPRGANPYISVVDGGTLEMVREIGVEVLSSADLLQQFTSVLSESQITTHLEAAQVLQETATMAWDLIAEKISKDQPISEYDVQQFMLSEFAARNCVTEEGPICAVNKHSAMPHYSATKQTSKRISRGDFILLDLWCKKDIPHAVYADITRVAVAASEPSPRHQQVFNVVKDAQHKAIEFVRKKMKAGELVKGSEVDDVCRKHIEQCGFGEYFTHRTGHNIDTQVHGAGAHLDNLETSDDRLLLPGMCFSIEPGIYLPGDFGIRLESDLLIRHDGSVEVTGGIEESMICLL